MNSTRDIQESETGQHAAFTLTELLVVVAVVALLATIAYPALAKTKNNGHAAQCQDNLRRLTLAWTLYVNDNSDRMVSSANPVSGAMDWTSDPQNTNAALLVDPAQSVLAKYVKDPTLYKCPADQYQGPLTPAPRVRSVSMNAALGNLGLTVINQFSGRTYFSARKMSDLTTPGPASIFVMLDEHPDSINDAAFQVILGSLPAAAQFRDLPGSFHDGGGSLSFADGHCEIKRWRDSKTLRTVLYTTYINTAVPNSVDYVWFEDHSPYKN